MKGTLLLGPTPRASLCVCFFLIQKSENSNFHFLEGLCVKLQSDYTRNHFYTIFNEKKYRKFFGGNIDTYS